MGRISQRMISATIIALAPIASHAQPQTQNVPRAWIDPSTGHRVVRLSDEPGSSSLYFNFNGYTPQGDQLVISTPQGLARVDLKTHKLTTFVKIATPFRFLFVGHRTRTAFYQTQSADGTGPKTVFAADVDSGKVRKVATLDRGDIQTINSDETLLAGVDTDPASDQRRTRRIQEARYPLRSGRLQGERPGRKTAQLCRVQGGAHERAPRGQDPDDDVHHRHAHR